MGRLIFNLLFLPFNILCALLLVVFTVVVLLPMLALFALARACNVTVDGKMTFNFRWMKAVKGFW